MTPKLDPKCFFSRVEVIETSRILERAMGIEPTSEAWEARGKNLKTLESAAIKAFFSSLKWKIDGKWNTRENLTPITEKVLSKSVFSVRRLLGRCAGLKIRLSQGRVSNRRLRVSSMSLFSSGRESFAPDWPTSTYSRTRSNPRCCRD